MPDQTGLPYSTGPSPSEAPIEQAAWAIGIHALSEGWEAVYLADLDGSPTRPGRETARAALNAAGVGELVAERDGLRRLVDSMAAAAVGRERELARTKDADIDRLTTAVDAVRALANKYRQSPAGEDVEIGGEILAALIGV